MALRPSDWAPPIELLTGQYKDSVRPLMLDGFGIPQTHKLNLMDEGESLSVVSARVLEVIDRLLEAIDVDVVVGQGDTVSVPVAPLGNFFHRIPVIHVEAVLRTGNFDFREEMNRVMASRLSRWYFAPTEEEKNTLLVEGVKNLDIWLAALPQPIYPSPIVQGIINAQLILSDSGGGQDKAPALGVPVLVLRNETGRPEAAQIGASKLVGTTRAKIVANVSMLLDDSNAYDSMANAGSPYGNGFAAQAIVATLRVAMH